MFLLDGSDETLSGFPLMKDFVQQVVETLNVGENNDRVSVVQYSQDQQTHFSLNTYIDKHDVLNAVLQLNHKGGESRNTGAALDYVRRRAFAASSGSRREEGVPQVLVLLTGGRSQDDVSQAAVGLKDEKIVPFCVGTRNADIIELQTVAHNPSYAFSLLRFDDFGSIYQQLVTFVKRVPRQQPSEKTMGLLGKAVYISLIQPQVNLYLHKTTFTAFFIAYAELLALKKVPSDAARSPCTKPLPKLKFFLLLQEEEKCLFSFDLR